MKFLNRKTLKLILNRFFRSNKDRAAITKSGSLSSSAEISTHNTLTSVIPDVSGDWIAAMDLNNELAQFLHRDVLTHDILALVTRLEPLMNDCGSPKNQDELKEAFNIFDVDRDGRISAEDLLVVFKAIGDERCTLEDCRRMIENIVREGDGFVCFKDFSHMMELQWYCSI